MTIDKHFIDDTGAIISVKFRDREHLDNWYEKNSPITKLEWTANLKPNIKKTETIKVEEFTHG